MDTNIQRSTFVTVITWIFIILSGFGALISLLQNIMIHTVFNTAQFSQVIHSMPPKARPIYAFIFAHIQVIFLSILIVLLIIFISSIGLLKRKNWARIFFIVIMVLGIIWNLTSFVMQFFVFSFMNGQIASMPNSPDMPDMHIFMIATAIFSGLIAIGFSVLFAWIIRKLISPAIITEFQPC